MNKIIDDKTTNGKVVLDKEEIKISFVGDILCQKEQLELAYSSKTGSYDFSASLSGVKKYFKNSDYVIGNLETPIGGKELKYVGEIKGFNAPNAFLHAIHETGFTLLTTANNHCLDRGIEGLTNTLHALDDVGVDHIGTSYDKTKDTIIMKNIGGINIAILNYTFGSNDNVNPIHLNLERAKYINYLSRPELQKYEDIWNALPSLLKIKLPVGLNKLILKTTKISDYCKIADDVICKIKTAKEMGADLIIVIPHMGVEFTQLPLKFSRNMVNSWFSAGADIIIGGHPHVLQPMEFRRIVSLDGEQRTGFVIYSLGNFLTANNPYWPSRRCMESVILNIHLSRDKKTNKVNIDKVSYIPTMIQTEEGAGHLNQLYVTSLYDAFNNTKDESKQNEVINRNAEIQHDLHWGENPDSEFKEVYEMYPTNGDKIHNVSSTNDFRYMIRRLPRIILSDISSLYHSMIG